MSPVWLSVYNAMIPHARPNIHTAPVIPSDLELSAAGQFAHCAIASPTKHNAELSPKVATVVNVAGITGPI
jgi:hypothetical protein